MDEYPTLRNIWRGSIPQEYTQAVDTIREMLIYHGPYQRPASGRNHTWSDDVGHRGDSLMQHLLVDELEDENRHIEKARAATWPDGSSRATHTLDDDLKVAAAHIARGTIRGKSIKAHRRQAADVVKAAAQALTHLNTRITEQAIDRLPTVAQFTGHMHFALLAALCDAMQWVDTTMVRGMLYGFPILGSIPDSGLFRKLQIEEMNGQTHDDFLTSKMGDILTPQNNREWTDELVRRLQATEQRLTTDAKLAADLQALEDVTIKEVTVDFNMLGPFTREQLDERFGKDQWRPSNRFAKEEATKIRPVDDGSSSKINAATRMQETITLPTVAVFAEIAREIYREAKQAGLDCPPLGLACDDWVKAYRGQPNCQPQYAVVAIYMQGKNKHHRTKGVFFFILKGNSYGTETAVVSFTRSSTFITVISIRLYCILAARPYIDDHQSMDALANGRSGQEATSALFKEIRHWKLSMPKRQWLAPVNTSLGIVCDVSTAHIDGTVKYTIKEGRADAFRQQLSACKHRAHVTQRDAQSLAGKIQFISNGVFGKIGRAQTQIFRHIAKQDSNYNWDKTLEDVSDFLNAVFDNDMPRALDIRQSTAHYS